MRFAWNGSTWTTGVDDTPAYPLDIVDETAGGIQRNYGGTARLHYRHDKRTFSLVWPQVGTNAPQVYVRDMITSASTVELAYHGGTYTCYPVPGSLRCSETGYYVYDISAQFTEA